MKIMKYVAYTNNMIIFAGTVLKIKRSNQAPIWRYDYMIYESILFPQDVSIRRSLTTFGLTSTELVVVDDNVLCVLASDVEPLTGVAQVLVLHGQVLHQDGSFWQTVRVWTEQPVFLVLELDIHLWCNFFNILFYHFLRVP